MTRLKWKNKFNNCRCYEKWCSYKFMRNFRANLLRKTKKKHYRKVNIKSITDNKTFCGEPWNLKASNLGKITLVENDAIISDDKEIAKTMNQFFINITKMLDLKSFQKLHINRCSSITSSFDNRISSIKNIREYFSILKTKYQIWLWKNFELMV